MRTDDKISEIMSLGSVIPVVEISDIDNAIPLAEALLLGGIKTIEITLRTDAALGAMEKIALNCPEMLVGAGTILNTAMLHQSMNAGASFGVSPGATDRLLEEVAANDFPFLPGGTTPSEIMRLLDHGYHIQKFFPAEASGGVAMLKSLAGPFKNVKFCPTGGVSLDNLSAYQALENVIVVGGSWIASRALIEDKNWTQITSNAKAAAD